MSCLIDSGYKGSITWLGRVIKPGENIRSEALKTAKSNFEGIVGESHSGTTRPACVRVSRLYPKNTEIRNTRQLSILSAEENAEKCLIENLVSFMKGFLAPTLNCGA